MLKSTRTRDGKQRRDAGRDRARRADPGRGGPGRRATDAGDGPGAGDRPVRGCPRGRARRERSAAGRPQRPGADPHGDLRSGDDPGPGAAGERPAGGRGRRTAEVHQPDPAAVHASVAAGGRGAAGAVSARVVDGRLPGGASGAARRGRGGPESDEHLAADGGLGGGVPGVPEPGHVGSRLRVRVGGRHSLQRPSGR